MVASKPSPMQVSFFYEGTIIPRYHVFFSKSYIEEGKPHFLFRLLSVSFFEGFLFKPGKNNAAIVCVA